MIHFSIVNNGGLRTSLPKGKITVGDVFELMPFENELVLLSLTGSQVSELADYIASRGGEGVSGISFGMLSGRAEGIKIQNRPLEPDSTYWMVTSDYIAADLIQECYFRFNLRMPRKKLLHLRLPAD